MSTVFSFLKKIFGITAVILFFHLAAGAQGRFAKRFPDRYQLDLPAEWNRPKLLGAINQILPKAIEELKDKDFCTECRGAYTVRLILDSPRVASRSNINKGYAGSRSFMEAGRLLQGAANQVTMQVTYRFRAALGIYDSSGQRVTQLLLVPYSDEQVKTKDTAMGGFYYTTETIRDREGRETKLLLPHFEDIPLSNNLQPDRDDLLRITEQRIYFIRDLIKNLR